ncbi:O-antigen ligase family protein [Bradyrhizobium liaoningense]|uniref:O-antigen ligase family protein n=1 Tax=Bradyrhizobium liaoningense TaxID=43992 RepID=UPI001BA7FF1F|nr:O-antigen ligase family protein [Bradyrhizobium liaoningense]MBR0706641.1 O-antigen ligase family protein [Bradyrhizobium liaoningense]
MNGSFSNSSSVSPLRADILFLILIGIFAAIGGGLTAMVGGTIPFFLYSLPIAAAVVLADYRNGVWLLVLLLPFASTQMVPRQVFEVTGFNSENCLLVLTFSSLCLASLREAVRFPHLPSALLVYVALIALAAYNGSGSAEQAITIPGEEPLTVKTYILDSFAKPMIILVVAWMAAVVSRNGGGQSLIWALAGALVAFFMLVVGDLVGNGISLESLASARERGFLSWTGMHANEIGLMANLGFAILLYTAAATARPIPRLTLFACAIAAAAMAALTFSRGAFIGLAIIVGHYLITRRRTGQIVLALSIIVGVTLLLPGAFVERATTGFATDDTHAITAGRPDMIWRPLLPTFWEAPILGHGLGSTMWATPNLHGEMLPVGHPHNAYLGVLLDMGMVGVAVVAAFFWSAWAMFRRLAKNHGDPLWRGVFEGGVVCLMCLAVQGLTDDRFVPTYPQVALWLCYGLALGQAQSTCSTKRTQP